MYVSRGAIEHLPTFDSPLYFSGKLCIYTHGYQIVLSNTPLDLSDSVEI